MSDSVPHPSDILTVADVARLLGVHVQTAQKAFRTGELAGRKVGHSWTTTRGALERYIEGGNKTAPDVPAGQQLPPLEFK